MNYQTIDVRFQDSICFLRFDRPEFNNTINARLIVECNDVLRACEESATVVVLSGTPEVFCLGADFGEIARHGSDAGDAYDGPGPLYDLWLKLAMGPFVSVAHVRGKANAGGIGFVAASDVVIADDTAQFSLSELLFGLYPACVLPFLIRRIGFQRAHYFTLSTKPIGVERAAAWGLVDSHEPQSASLLRRHLLRLRRLSKPAVSRYKTYVNRIGGPLANLKSHAVEANREVFRDTTNLAAIARYVEHGVFPWEQA